MNQPEPRQASESQRAEVLQALKNDQYSLYSNARRYLKDIGFSPETIIVEDLVGYLEEGSRLYLFQGPNIKIVKYQCCLRYEDCLVIHVKLTPRQESDTFNINIGCHSHNTGYSPLPA